MSGALFAAAAERLAAALAGASLAAAALVAGCAALLFLGRRLPPRIGVALWWLVALRILLELAGVSGIALPLLPAASTGSFVATTNIPAAVPPREDLAAALAPRAPRAAAESHPGLDRARAGAIVAAFVWVAGLAIVLAVEIRRGTRLAAVVRRARPVTDPRVRVASAKAAAALGLERRVPLLLSDEIATPMVVGLLRPRLLLPAEAPLAGDELRLVLLHELAHVRRRDALFALVPALARRLFWFHPLVRFAEREYALATEAACDTEVLARAGAEPARYGRLLVRFAASRDEGLVPAWAFAAHPLERRLRMLVSAPLAGRRLLVAAPIVLVAALGVALPVRVVAAPGEAPAAPAVPAPPAESAVPATPSVPSAPATPALPEAGRRWSRAAVPPAPPVAPAAPAALPELPVAAAWSPASLPAPPAPPAAPAPPARPALATRSVAVPVAAAAPVAPVAATAPAPPVPPAPPARPAWSELDPGDAVILVDGDTQFVVNASSSERRRARELAADGEPVVIVRRRGATWVMRDRATVDEVRQWIDTAVAVERERAEEMRAEAERVRARLELQVEAQRADADRLAGSARAAADELARHAQELAAAESERARAMAEAATSDAHREIETARREIERRRERLERERADFEARYRERSESDRERIESQLRRELARSESELYRAAGRDLDADLEALLDRLIAERRAERLPK